MPFEQPRFRKHLTGVLTTGAILIVLVALPSVAWASPGCTQFSGAILVDGNGSPTFIGSASGANFAEGDTLSFSGPGGIPAELVTSAGSVPQSLSGSIRFPADSPTGTAQLFTSLTGPNSSISWSCTPGPNKSQILEQTRQAFSKIGAQVSSEAMGEATSDAISDAFSSGGTTQFGGGRIRTSFAAIENAQLADDTSSSKVRDAHDAFAALGYAKAPYAKALPVARSPWHVWIDGRFTGFEDKSAASFDGWHNNITGGASYRFTDNFLAGLLVGYENSNYGMTSLLIPTSLRGEGLSGGGYFGWKFYDRLRLDGMLTYGRIDYRVAASSVSGSFGADRLTGMGKLSGRYGLGTFWIEPAAMLTIASERQDSFTDTAAVFHDKFNFTVGRASTGGTVGTPLVWGTAIVTPTFGVFGDYRFGDETAAALSAVPTFSNGWSARINGGVSIAMPGNVIASATGEYGGLGQDLTYWRAKGSLGVKF